MMTIVGTAVLYNILKLQNDEMPAEEDMNSPVYEEFNEIIPARQAGNLVKHKL